MPALVRAPRHPGFPLSGARVSVIAVNEPPMIGVYEPVWGGQTVRRLLVCSIHLIRQPPEQQKICRRLLEPLRRLEDEEQGVPPVWLLWTPVDFHPAQLKIKPLKRIAVHRPAMEKLFLEIGVDVV